MSKKQKINLHDAVILKYDFTGTLVAEYDSNKIAAMENNVTETAISCATNKHQHSAAGSFWLRARREDYLTNKDKYKKYYECTV